MASIMKLGFFFCVVASIEALPTVEQNDLKTDAKLLVKMAHSLTNQAREGSYLKDLIAYTEDLQMKADEVLNSTLNNASECQTNFITKMAAAATKSHEVLSLLLADDDEMEILNGRLAMAWSMMDNVADQLNEQLSFKDDDIASHVTALMFTVQLSENIMKNAEDLYNEQTTYLAENTDKESSSTVGSDKKINRVKRQALKLGGGFGVGSDGLSWTNRRGSFSIYGRPTFNLKPFRITGVQAGIRIRF